MSDETQVVYAVKSKVPPMIDRRSAVEDMVAKSKIMDDNEEILAGCEDKPEELDTLKRNLRESKILSAALNGEKSLGSEGSEELNSSKKTDQNQIKGKVQPELNPQTEDGELIKKTDSGEEGPPTLTPVEIASTNRSRASNGRFPCTECPKTFLSRIALDAHFANHSEVLYPCDFCEKSFKWKQSLQAHVQCHINGYEPCQCSKCSKTFALQSKCQAHMKICTGPSDKSKPLAAAIDTAKEDKSKAVNSTDSSVAAGKRASGSRVSSGTKHQIEQSGLPIKKRGRPAKMPQSPPNINQDKHESKKTQPTTKRPSEKTVRPATPPAAESSPVSNAVKTDHESPTNESTPTRSQRKRNPPKWTENMVMDYDVSYAIAVPRSASATSVTAVPRSISATTASATAVPRSVSATSGNAVPRSASVSATSASTGRVSGGPASRKSSVESVQSVIAAEMTKAVMNIQKRQEKGADVKVSGASASAIPESAEVDEKSKEGNNQVDTLEKSEPVVTNDTKTENKSILPKEKIQKPVELPIKRSKVSEKTASKEEPNEIPKTSTVAGLRNAATSKTAVVANQKQDQLKSEKANDVAVTSEKPTPIKNTAEETSKSTEKAPSQGVQSQKGEIDPKLQTKTTVMLAREKSDSEVFTRSRITRTQFVTGLPTDTKNGTETEPKTETVKASTTSQIKLPGPSHKKSKGGRKRKVKKGKFPSKKKAAEKVEEPDTLSSDDKEGEEEAMESAETTDTKPIETPNPVVSSPNSLKRKESFPISPARSVEKMDEKQIKHDNKRQRTDDDLQFTNSETQEPAAKRTRLAEQETKSDPPKIELQQPIPMEVTPPPLSLPQASSTISAEANVKETAAASTNGFGTSSIPSADNNGTHFAGMPKLLVQNRVPPVEFIECVDDSSSESEGESGFTDFHPPPSRRNSAEPYIKDEVIRFVQSKISNRNMLRIRQELMVLKQSGNYFKLTKTAPLAAGLIHEMFCQTTESSSGEFQ